jgi:hypothetical protein
MDKESATISIHSNYISSVGGPVLIAKGIPIKQILGDMYNKYNKFKLVLNTHVANYSTTAGNNTQLFIRVSGLDFTNTTEYNKNMFLNRNPIFLLESTRTTTVKTQTSAICGAVFNKPSSPNIDLTITFLKTDLSVVDYNVGTNYFVFSIYGLEE